MVRSVRIFAALGVGVAIGMCAAAKPASAISVELAKKCRALMIKAHPYKMAGSRGPGTAQAERDYYNACIAHGGNMPTEPPAAGQGESGQSQPPAPPK